MKKFLLSVITLIIFFNANAQSGNNCSNAIPITPTATCTPTTITTTNSDIWFSFVATSQYTQIRTTAPTFGINGPHLHELILYSGSCSSLQVLEDEIFAEASGANEIIIDASGLTVGNTYYVQASRMTSRGICVPTVVANACGGVSSITFSLCVRSLNVIIPKDFGLESVSISHSYYTNKGQIADVNGNSRNDIKYYSSNSSPIVYYTDTAVSFVFAKVDTIKSTQDSTHRVDMSLVGANTNLSPPFKTEKINGYVNYFLPQVRTGAVNVKGYSRTIIESVYPNIDMQYYSNDVGIKFYFIVKPGGNPDNIIMNFAGANSVTVNANKGLDIQTTLGKISFEAGHAYQINPAGNIVPMPWQAEFIQLSPTSVKLDIRNYPTNFPLFIQIDRGHIAPTTTTSSNFWSTYVGGSMTEPVKGSVEMDASDNAYWSGGTSSPNFPILGAMQGTNLGSFDAFVAKFNTNRGRDFVTYFGASNDDWATTVQIDGSGNIYFAGNTQSANFPVSTSPPSYQSFNGGFSNREDCFIVKLTPNGQTKLWASYFGGADYDALYAMNVTSGGDIFIGGRTFMDTLFYPGKYFPFPVSQPPGAYVDTTYNGGQDDGFFAKFDASFNLVWSTYLGGSAREYVTSMATDKSGNLFVVSHTESKGDTTLSCSPVAGVMPLCDPGSGAYTQNNNGGFDKHIAKFRSTGILLWATMYGGSNWEGHYVTDGDVTDIDIDASGNIYIIGSTTSTDMPLFNAVQGSNTGGFNAMVLKFTNGGVPLFADYYGGGNAIAMTEYGYGIAADGNGNIYITGQTFNPTFPVINSSNFYNYGSLRGQSDAFIAGLDKTTFQAFWSTYLGGTCREAGDNIAISASGKSLIVVGQTASALNDFPLFDLTGNSDYYDGTYNGDVGTGYCDPFVTSDGDGFIGSFCLSCPSTVGIEETNSQNENLNVIVYPNPGSNEITIESKIELDKNASIIIINSLGQIIYSGKPTSNRFRKTKIDITHFADGIYIVRLLSGNATLSGKFIKQ
ncbi:MAG: SBBP repeat-containing protein [Bacteroidetes bacterium]|nr:SBBP repeat-containing protein [Bacteroidota bacterium]